jgi:hypothetical protein
MADNFLMKGKVFSEREHLLSYPAVAEVKYDEIRLHVKAVKDQRGLVTGVEFLSYAGKPLHNLEQWAPGFVQFLRYLDLDHLDLGVCVNNCFNDSYRWVRSSKGIPKEKLDKATGKVAPALFPHMVEFYLFDIPELGGKLEQRLHRLDELRWVLLEYLEPWDTPVKRPERKIVQNREELDAYFVDVRERGFEGLMVKDYRGEYVYGCAHRSDWWLKMKPENEADGKIVGINRAYSITGEPLNRAGSVTVLCEDNSGAAPAGIPHELGADMFANPEKYLGRWIEFKYMERDRQGGYRHPSFTRFREDKA